MDLFKISQLVSGRAETQKVVVTWEFSYAERGGELNSHENKGLSLQ